VAPDSTFPVNPDPDSIWIQGVDDQKLKEKYSKLQEKASALNREHPALQKMKFINLFPCLGVIFALIDPDTDPGTPLNPDLIGY
jgi:hypothetical protein